MSAAARDRLLLLAGALALWAVAARAAGDLALASPLATLRALGAMARDPEMLGDLADTARAVAEAAAIALAGGAAAGIALAGSPRLGGVAEPLLSGFYALPKLMFYPVILLLFGLGFQAKVAFGVIHGIVPVALFTAAGVRGIPPIYRRAARAMRLDAAATARRVLLPGALPEIVAGARVGLALTIAGTLIGEMFASQAGLGYALRQAMARSDTPAITALAVAVLAIALLLDRALVRLAGAFGHQALHAA